MSLAEVVGCPRCQTPSGMADHYCGSCGARLADLVLEEDRIIVAGDLREATIAVSNRGVREGSAVLRGHDAASLPAWITGVAGVDDAVTLGRGQQATWRVELQPEHVSGGAIGHHRLPILTSMLEVDPSTSALRRRFLEVELATAGRARARPGALYFRFVPRAHVDEGQILAEQIQLRNEGGHPIQLEDLAVVDEPPPALPSNWILLPAAQILVAPPPKGTITLEPGAAHDVRFALRLEPGALDDGAIGAFAGAIELAVKGQPPLRVPIGGVIGDGPTLVTDDPLPAVIRCQGRTTRAQLSLKNPGCAPLVITRVEVADEEDDDGSGPAAAWLSAGLGVPLPLVLAPGAEQTLTLLADPSGRASEHMDAPWGQGRVEIHHDGYETIKSRHLAVAVRAELGRVRVLERAVLGVDFGTSNSSTTLLHGASGRSFPLPLEPQAGRDQLASLLFFRGESGHPEEGPFLFGRAAENAASLRWANLVRSIKSVIARDPKAVWHFLGHQRGGLSTFRSLELLEVFMGELKRRSEVGIRSLPADFLDELGLTASGVRFAHVVFTHPVGAPEPVMRALHRAARTAGLVDDELAFEPFVANQCLDEALAASVAFTYVVAGAQTDRFISGDLQRVICVDVGGGTTDLAAVEIDGLASFREGSRPEVALTLRASGGDDHFGGDDVDRVLAALVLERVEGQEAGRELDTDAIRRALTLPSFESFRRYETDRHEATGQIAGPDVDRAAQVAFSAASDLLRACERAKCQLGEEENAVVSPQVADWPTRLPGARLPPGLRLDVELSRLDAAERYRPFVSAVAQRLDALVDGAGWSWADVDTLLFTGQGSRLAELRSAVRGHVEAKREAATASSGAAALNVVEPGGLEGFDPKHCVAMGAAVWGDSQAGGGGWLRIAHRSADELSYHLTVRRGPRFLPLDGLSAGTPFPASATHTLGAATDVVTLHQGRKLLWTFRLPRPVTEVVLVVESDHAAHALVEGQRVEGERSTDG